MDRAQARLSDLGARYSDRYPRWTVDDYATFSVLKSNAQSWRGALERIFDLAHPGNPQTDYDVRRAVLELAASVLGIEAGEG
jgi:hypothetical protein